MWVPRSGIQGIVGSVGKSEDFSTLSTMPSFPQSLFSFKMGLVSPTGVGLNVVVDPFNGGKPHVENSPVRHLDLLQVH